MQHSPIVPLEYAVGDLHALRGVDADDRLGIPVYLTIYRYLTRVACVSFEAYSPPVISIVWQRRMG